jgi:hypothetical protein
MPTSHRAIGSITSYRSVVCYRRKGFMNPKVVKLREEREKNVVKVASLQARNKKIDGMDICTAVPLFPETPSIPRNCP